MNSFKKNIYKGKIEEIPPASTFNITSSVPNGSGIGTLDIVNGEAYETIYLSFNATNGGTFNSITFSAPVSVPVIDDLHLSRNGTITLDSNGSATSNYEFTPTTGGSSCLVTVTSRSSNFTYGVGFFTNIVQLP